MPGFDDDRTRTAFERARRERSASTSADHIRSAVLVRSQLTAAFTRGVITAGTPINEADVMADLRAGRRAVRTALAGLAEDGIVERRQGVATRLARPMEQVQLLDKVAGARWGVIGPVADWSTMQIGARTPEVPSGVEALIGSDNGHLRVNDTIQYRGDAPRRAISVFAGGFARDYPNAPSPSVWLSLSRADATMAGQLDVPTSSLLLTLTSIVLDVHGRIHLVMEHWSALRTSLRSVLRDPGGRLLAGEQLVNLPRQPSRAGTRPATHAASLAAIMRLAIQNGMFDVGDVTDEAALVSMFGGTRGVTRAALDLLVRNGTVVRRRHAGTRIVCRPRSVSLDPDAAWALAGEDAPLRVEGLFTMEIPTPQASASLLTEAGPTIVVSGWRAVLDDDTSIVSFDYAPRRLAGGIPPRNYPDYFAARYGSPLEVEWTVHALTADHETAELLDIYPGDEVILMERVMRTADGTARELSHTLYPARRVSLRFTMHEPAPDQRAWVNSGVVEPGSGRTVRTRR